MMQNEIGLSETIYNPLLGVLIKRFKLVEKMRSVA